MSGENHEDIDRVRTFLLICEELIIRRGIELVLVVAVVADLIRVK